MAIMVIARLEGVAIEMIAMRMAWGGDQPYFVNEILKNQLKYQCDWMATM